MLRTISVPFSIADAEYVVSCDVYGGQWEAEALVNAIFSAVTGDIIPVQEWEEHGFDHYTLEDVAQEAMKAADRE
jgi:hypothetical protein